MDRQNGKLLFDAIDLRAAPNLLPVVPETDAEAARDSVQDELAQCELLEISLRTSPLNSERGRLYDIRGQIAHLGRLANELSRIVEGQKVVAGFESYLSNR